MISTYLSDSFYPLIHLLLFFYTCLYLRTLEKQKFLKHSGWSSHTHALKNWGNAQAVVFFPQPKYCYKFTVLTPNAKHQLLTTILTKQPNMHTHFCFFYTH